MDRNSLMRLLDTYSPLLNMSRALLVAYHAPDIIKMGREAEEQALKAYPKPEQSTREVDAYRHLVWQGSLAKKYGKGVAEFVGNAHESPLLPIVGGMGQPKSQQVMDLYNNMLGRDMSNLSYEDMDSNARKMIDSGKAKLNAEAGSY